MQPEAIERKTGVELTGVKAIRSSDLLAPKIVDIISLGAGVQSSTLAMMAARGEITPMPKAAIFADTQAEPAAVMTWLAWLEKQLPFPVYRVTRGNLRKDSLRVPTSRKSGRKYLKGLIPAYILKRDGTRGLLGRKCTADYKVAILVKKTRELCEWSRGEKRHLATVWIGISCDEVIRMKPSRNAFIEHRWPLIDAGMTRRDCEQWWENQTLYTDRPYKYPPRSACTFCPFHSDVEWKRIKTETPDEWNAVVEYEHDLIAAGKRADALQGVPYLHESCRPIETVNFDKLIPSHHQIDLFGNECEGLCGV